MGKGEARSASLGGAGRASDNLSRVSIKSQGLRAHWTCAVESRAQTGRLVTFASECEIKCISHEYVFDGIEWDGSIAAAPGWPERAVIVHCVELFIDTTNAPTAVIAWKKNCEFVT